MQFPVWQHYITTTLMVITDLTWGCSLLFIVQLLYTRYGVYYPINDVTYFYRVVN